MGSAGERIDRLHAAVEPMESHGDVLVERKGRRRVSRATFVHRPEIPHRIKEVRQFALEVRAEMMKEKVVAAEDARGHHNVGVHGPVRKAQPAGQDAAPALRLAAGILIADEKRGADFLEERFERIVGMPAHDEFHAAFGGIFGDIAEGLVEKVIVAQIGVGVIGDDREEDDDRKAEEVRGFDGDVEGGVVGDAESALHPVNNAARAGTRIAGAANEDARLIGEPCELFRNAWTTLI